MNWIFHLPWWAYGLGAWLILIAIVLKLFKGIQQINQGIDEIYDNEMARRELMKVTYICPACGIVAVENEGDFCSEYCANRYYDERTEDLVEAERESKAMPFIGNPEDVREEG